MEFVAELWGFLRARKKFWLAADRGRDGAVRRPAGAGQGLGRRAVHLHAVLRAAPCGSSASRPSTTTAPPPSSSTARSSPRRRRSASPARSTTPRFPAQRRRATASREAGIDARRRSTTSSSTTSRSSSSSACSRPTSRSRRAASARSAWPCRSGCSEKLFQKSLLRDELAAMPGVDCERQAAVHRAPRSPRGQRVLPLALRGGRDPDHGRRRRVGDDVASASAAATTLELAQGAPLPALARPALLGLHLLHRLQGQLRRVQGDGPRALRRAAATPTLIHDHLIDLKPTTASFRLDHGLLQLLHRPDDDRTSAFDALFGGPPREPESRADAARDGPRRARSRRSPRRSCCGSRRTLARETGERNLCLAGGVALNCVANGRILREGPFERHLDPAGGRRRRRRARRGARSPGTSSSGKPRARRRPAHGRA